MSNYNTEKSIINDICLKEADIQKFKSAKQELGVSFSVAKKAKVMKSGSFDKLEEALYSWLKQQRERGSPITGHILMQKASELSKLLYKTSDDKPFTASGGFQWRFFQRYRIRNLALVGEKLNETRSLQSNLSKISLI